MQQNNKQQVKCKIHKGDEVVVLTGRSRGVTGNVERVDRKHGKVYVAGANLYKRHQKPSMLHPEGGIVEKPMAIDVSNIAYIDPKTKKATRIGYQTDDSGKKVRIAKASGTILG